MTAEYERRTRPGSSRSWSSRRGLRAQLAEHDLDDARAELNRIRRETEGDSGSPLHGHDVEEPQSHGAEFVREAHRLGRGRHPGPGMRESGSLRLREDGG